MKDSAFDEIALYIESISELDDKAKHSLAVVRSLNSTRSLTSQMVEDISLSVKKFIRKMNLLFQRLKFSGDVFLYGIYFGVFLVLKLILTALRELTQCVFYVKYKYSNVLILKIKSIFRLRYESKAQYLYVNSDVDLEGMNV